MPKLSTLSKPYSVTDAKAQSEDIEYMFEEVYQALSVLNAPTAVTTSATGKDGLTAAQVAARVLHEL